MFALYIVAISTEVFKEIALPTVASIMRFLRAFFLTYRTVVEVCYFCKNKQILQSIYMYFVLRLFKHASKSGRSVHIVEKAPKSFRNMLTQHVLQLQSKI